LLTAGIAAARGDEELSAAVAALRPLVRQVPALAAIADGADRLEAAKRPEAAKCLLDLTLLLVSVRAVLSSAGREGKATPVPRSGPWSAQMTADQLYPLAEALARSGKNRVDPLENALAVGSVNDLRLLPRLLAALGNSYGDLADRVAAKALPGFGRAVLPELLAKLAESLREGDPTLKRIAAEALGDIGPPEGVRALAEALADSDWLARWLAAQTLASLGRKGRSAIPALERAQQDANDSVRLSVAHALRCCRGVEGLDAQEVSG
jgi:HEAT repeat protein